MFKHKLRDLRRENHLTQEGLAKILNMTKATICLYESGAREPSAEVLYKLSTFFNVTMDWLMSEDSFSIKQRPQANTVTIIGRAGEYKTIELKEEDIVKLEKLVEDMQNSNTRI